MECWLGKKRRKSVSTRLPVWFGGLVVVQAFVALGWTWQYAADYNTALMQATRGVQDHLHGESAFNRSVTQSLSKQTQQSTSLDNSTNTTTIDWLDLKNSLLFAKQTDVSPFVLESHKLLFFTVPKVACTTWKQLFRRMMGYSDWKSNDRVVLHHLGTNGLRTLNHYSQNSTAVLEMLTSPNWTRAMFVRDPKERFLSAYLDKGLRDPGYVETVCCRKRPKQRRPACRQTAHASLGGFLKIVRTCPNDIHWTPQGRRLPPHLWKLVNFVGYNHQSRVDAERLLRRIGAWEPFGATGWGRAGNESIFQSTALSQHTTSARDKLLRYYTPELEEKVDRFLEVDYQIDILNLTRTRLFPDDTTTT